jgi:GAF domain-containing protein
VEVASFEGYRFTGTGKLKTVPDGWSILTRILREWVAGLASPIRNPYIGFRGAHPAHIWAQNSTHLLEISPYARGNGGGENGNPATHSNGKGKPKEAVHELLKQILQISMKSVSATSGSVVAVGDSGEIEGAFLAGTGQAEALPTEKLSDTMHQGLAGWVVHTRRPTLVPGTREEPRWVRRSWEGQDGEERSAIGIPVLASDQVVGALVLSRPKEEQFTAEELEQLQNITGA